MGPPKAWQALSIGLRNCYVARFEHPLKELQKPRSSLRRPLTRKTLCSSLRRRPSCFTMEPPKASQALSIGLRNCYVARFEHPLKESKAPQQLAKAFDPQNPLQQLARVSRLLCHGAAAACEGVPPALPWDFPRPHKLFILGFETATWHVLSTP